MIGKGKKWSTMVENGNLKLIRDLFRTNFDTLVRIQNKSGFPIFQLEMYQKQFTTSKIAPVYL